MPSTALWKGALPDVVCTDTEILPPTAPRERQRYPGDHDCVQDRRSTPVVGGEQLRFDRDQEPHRQDWIEPPLLEAHRAGGALATITVAQPKSQFGLVDVDDENVVHGFEEAGRVPYWVNCGNYVLSEEAIERFPARGDHESSTFPELAAEGRLRAYRHAGLWLTVNTPKELRLAAEHVASHPEWLA